jgi:hypothetical protein
VKLLYGKKNDAFNTDHGVAGASATRFDVKVDHIHSQSAISFFDLASVSGLFLLFANMRVKKAQSDLFGNCRPV